MFSIGAAKCGGVCGTKAVQCPDVLVGHTEHFAGTVIYFLLKY